MLLEPRDPFDVGGERLEAREERDPELDRPAPEDVLVLEHPLELLLGEGERDVEEEVDPALVEGLEDVRVTIGLRHLVDDPNPADPPLGEERLRVLRRADPEAEGAQALGGGQELLLEGGSPDRDERGPSSRDELHPGRHERLHEGVREGRSEAGDLAGRLHLHSEERVGAGELEEGELGDLHAPATRWEGGDPLPREGLPEHRACGLSEEGHAGRLREERQRSARPEVELDDLVPLLLHEELDVERTPNAQVAGELAGRAEELALDLGRGVARGKAEDGVPRVDPRAFDVL